MFDTFASVPPLRYNVSDRRDFFMELKKHITDEQTGIGYMLCGDVRCISLVSEFSRLKEETS